MADGGADLKVRQTFSPKLRRALMFLMSLIWDARAAGW
jgi:hypothetical protein